MSLIYFEISIARCFYGKFRFREFIEETLIPLVHHIGTRLLMKACGRQVSVLEVQHA